MLRRIPSVLLIAAVLAVLPSVSAADTSGKDRYIVVFKDSVSGSRSIATEHSNVHSAVVTHVYSHALKGYAGLMTPQAAERVAADPRVAFVEPDQRVHALGEVPTGVDRMEGDKKLGLGDGVYSSTDVDIAILDTGIQPDHPDLNVVGGVNCLGGIFISSCTAGNFADDNEHGTHVAGIAAAKDDGAGVVGVSPGARLWAVKVLDAGGSGFMSWIVAGIDWVRSQSSTIEVANMSLGCECTSSSMSNALTNATNAGVAFVVAAGNNARDASTFAPANHPQVIAVSAVADFDGKAGGGAAATCRVDQDDSFADFSNFGSVVDIAAPGVCIQSTVPGGGYATFSGTSMASPHGAGAAALYIVENSVPRSQTRWSAVRSGLQSSAWSVPQSDPCGFTGGRSAERLLMLALPCDMTGSPPPPPPSNTPPIASFAFTCASLTCDFDGSGSSDAEGPIAGYEWDFGDGTTGSGATASHGYASDGTYSVTLTVTDAEGLTDVESKSVNVQEGSDYGFVATGRKVKGIKYVDLSWNPGAFASTTIDVWRNGLPVGRTANDGLATDGPLGRGGGTYYYFICETGNANNCSNLAIVEF